MNLCTLLRLVLAQAGLLFMTTQAFSQANTTDTLRLTDGRFDIRVSQF